VIASLHVYRRYSSHLAADHLDDRFAQQHRREEEAARRFLVVVVREQSRLRDALACQQVEAVDVLPRLRVEREEIEVEHELLVDRLGE